MGFSPSPRNDTWAAQDPWRFTRLESERLKYAEGQTQDLVIDIDVASLSRLEKTFLFELLKAISFFDASAMESTEEPLDKPPDVLIFQGPTRGTKKRSYDPDSHPRELDVLVSWIRMHKSYTV